MKRFILALGLLIASVTFVTSQAQHVNISININNQPAWGPTGYDYVDYYYIPEINVYYNVPASMFYYWDRGRWIAARYLPYAYRRYDLYGMYKVVLNMSDPWSHNRYHIRDYARYKGVRTQHVIYYANDNRYNHSRRNTVSWYEGDKYRKPSERHDNSIRSVARRNNSGHDGSRGSGVNHNRAYNDNNRNNNIRSSNNQDKAVRNSSVTRSSNQRNSSRSQQERASARTSSSARSNR